MTVIVTTDNPTLSHDEKHVLLSYEKTISEGLATFYAVGNALLVIRDQRLYRGTHDTFEAYVTERWGMSDRHARRLIDASNMVLGMQAITADVQDQTGPVGPVPTSERQARELVGLEPEVAVEVMIAATEGNTVVPTAERIRAAREHVVPDRVVLGSGRVTGPKYDSRDATPQSPTARRRPLSDDLRSLSGDLARLERKVDRLLADDRLVRYADVIPRGDLGRLLDRLHRLADAADVAR